MRWVLLFVALWGCTPRPAAPAAEAPAAEAAEPEAHEEAVRWVPVEPAGHLSSLEAPARALVPPDSRALVSVPLSARVMRVRVRPGETVKANQPVVDVVMPELIAAAGALSAASIRLEAYAERHARLQELLEQRLARAAEVAELEAQMALARADRESARATLRAAGVSDEQAVGSLAAGGSMSLRAPIAGIVTMVSATAGEVRDPSSGALVELAQNASAQVEARFSIEPRPEYGFEWIDATRRVPLVLEAVSPAASGEAGTRVAWLHAADAAAGPAAGSLGRVRLVPPQSWVVVPTGALHDTKDGHTLHVQDGDSAKDVAVRVVMQSGAESVVEGVSAGQRVAIEVRPSAGGGHAH